MKDTLAGPELRALKARAQLLKPVVRIGKDGLSPGLLQALDEALTSHELVKVKFDEFKEEKKQLSPELAQKVSAHIIMRVGNVLVLFRRKPSEK